MKYNLNWQRVLLSGVAFFVLFQIAGHTSLAKASTLDIGFITDWEYAQNNQGDKLSEKAPQYLKSAVKALNKKKPQLVIGGGDYIRGQDLDKKEAKEQLKEINKVFKKLDTDNLYYLAGNHDLRSLSTDSYQSALKINYLHKVIDREGFRIILLDTNFKENGDHYSNKGYADAYVSDEELDWLREKINETTDPVIIFSHHSPMEKGSRRDINNATEVKNAISESGKVVAVVSGHNPTQYHKEENGVHYIIVNNLTNRKSKRTYAFIRAERNGSEVSLKVDQYGGKRKSYSIEKTVN